MARLRVSLVRSLNGRPVDQRATVRALGLTRMHSAVVHEDTPSIRGMVRKVRHLVRVEEAAAEPAAVDESPAETEAAGDQEAE